MDTVIVCNKCGRTTTTLDEGFSPALHGYHCECGGRWIEKPAAKAKYFIMKQNSAYVSGWECCGAAVDMAAARDIQEAHTARMQDGKIHSRPQIWNETEFDQWQAR